VSLATIENDDLDDLDELTALDNGDFDLLFDSLTRTVSVPSRLGDRCRDLDTNQAQLRVSLHLCKQPSLRNAFGSLQGLASCKPSPCS
jgi:hypothetical protein